MCGARHSFEFLEGTSLHLDLTLELQRDKNNVILERNNTSTENLLRRQATAQLNSKPIMIFISTRQRQFSSWTFDEFKAQYNINPADSYTNLKMFELDPVDVEAVGQGKEGSMMLLSKLSKYTRPVHRH
jgi:hypothetical protein